MDQCCSILLFGPVCSLSGHLAGHPEHHACVAGKASVEWTPLNGGTVSSASPARRFSRWEWCKPLGQQRCLQRIFWVNCNQYLMPLAGNSMASWRFWLQLQITCVSVKNISKCKVSISTPQGFDIYVLPSYSWALLGNKLVTSRNTYAPSPVYTISIQSFTQASRVLKIGYSIRSEKTCSHH